MLRTPNFGRRSLNEIKEVLARPACTSAWISRAGLRCRIGSVGTYSARPKRSLRPTSWPIFQPIPVMRIGRLLVEFDPLRPN
jgi:hypothetical protein